MIDRFDLLALVALGLIAWGLAAIYWPLAPLVTGGLLLAGLVYREWRKGKEAERGPTNADNQPGAPG